MSPLARAPLAVAFTLATVGCAGPAHLVASDGSHRLVASDPNHGLTVVVTTEAWAENELGEQLTIVHLLVSNLGRDPVLLAPGDFALTDSRGFRYPLRDAGAAFHLAASGEPPEDDDVASYDRGSAGDFEAIRSVDGSLGRLALPWGVLEPGTQMRGFLYFDDVRETANHATLAWRSQTPEHRALADFGFRLHVAHPRD